MKIRVLLFARLKEIASSDHLDLELSSPRAVSDLKALIARNYRELGTWLKCCMFSVNGELVEDHRILSEGDEVAMLPPASGGEGEIVLTDSSIDPERVLEGMDDTRDGALVLFLGKVRMQTGDILTNNLVYEAHGPVATNEIGKIILKAKKMYQLRFVRVHHRLGSVAPGQISIAVAVTAQHRKEAFEGCSYIMDQVKTSAPIWKKEVNPEGEGLWIHPGSPEDALG